MVSDVFAFQFIRLSYYTLLITHLITFQLYNLPLDVALVGAFVSEESYR